MFQFSDIASHYSDYVLLLLKSLDIVFYCITVTEKKQHEHLAKNLNPLYCH